MSYQTHGKTKDNTYGRLSCNYYSRIRQPDRIHPALRPRASTLESPKIWEADRFAERESVGGHRRARPQLYTGLSAQTIDHHGPAYLENPRSAPSPPYRKFNRTSSLRTRRHEAPPLSYKAPAIERQEAFYNKPLPCMPREPQSLSATRTTREPSCLETVSRGNPPRVDVPKKTCPEGRRVTGGIEPSPSRHARGSTPLASERAFQRRRSSIGDRIRMFTRSLIGVGHER